MGALKICRTIAMLAASLTVAVSAADDFHSEFSEQLYKLYGPLKGMKSSETFISSINLGELREFKREGGNLIPLQRNPNDYRSAPIQADPLAWIDRFSHNRQESILKKLVREKSFGKGEITFNRRNTNERRLDGILRSICKFLDVDVDTKSHQDFEIIVSWDDIVMSELMPTYLSEITNEFKHQGKDPYSYLKGVDSTHESWIVLKTVKLYGLNIEIAFDKPIAYTDLHLTNIVTFGKSRKANGNYCFELDGSTTVASHAVNISRGDIYKNAGLAMPKR